MTCLIAAKNSEYTILASDTWNHTKNEENHVIRKIAIGEGIIIGQAGVNEKETSDGHSEKILDLMKKWCNIYAELGFDIVKVIKIIKKDSDLFINDIDFEKDKNGKYKEINCYFIIIAHDFIINKNMIYKYYGYKNRFLNCFKPEFRMVRDNEMNTFCTSWGSHSNNFNYEHKDTDFEGASKIDLIDTVTGFVQRQINQEINIESNERTVGGSVEYCIMDNDGNIETNFG